MEKQPAHRALSFSCYLISLLLLMPPLASAGLKLPPAHQITYNIDKYGSHIGQLHSALSIHNQLVVYKSTTTASGFASLFVNDELKETSILSYQQASQPLLRQQSFSAHKGEDAKYRQNMSFQWQGTGHAVINGQYRNKRYQLNSDELIWSRHLIPLLMSSDLQQEPNTHQGQLHVTDRGKRQRYSYTLVQSEKISIRGKSYDTLKFRVIRDDSSRTSFIWLSRQHHYLPLKIEQFKKDRLHLKMVMDAFKTS